MNARERSQGWAALLLRAGWGRDAAAAALASASRDAMATDATLRAIENTRARVLDTGRARPMSSLDAAAMQRGVDHLAAIERLKAVATERHDEALALASRRREASRAAQARVDALERRRDDDRRSARHDADRRAADEVDRQWLARHRPDGGQEDTP